MVGLGGILGMGLYITHFMVPPTPGPLAVVNTFQKEGLPVKFVEYNAFKYETYQVMLETVIKAEGRLDILVNNFGTGNPKKDLDLIHGSEINRRYRVRSFR